MTAARQNLTASLSAYSQARPVKIGILRILIAIGATFLVSSAALAGECLDYEPAIVTIRGSVSLMPAYGPPGFGEDPEHDAREDYLALTFNPPACTKVGLNSLMENVAEADIRAIQLVFRNGEEFQQAKQWIGETIAVTGSLYHGFTGHHHTAVLLKVSEIREPVKAR
jgi:hypothetical protein